MFESCLWLCTCGLYSPLPLSLSLSVSLALSSTYASLSSSNLFEGPQLRCCSCRQNAYK